MNVSLTPELEQFIAQQVETGLYHTSSEVVRDALRRFKEQDELRREESALRRKLEAGVKDLEEGRWISGEEWREERLKKRASRQNLNT